MFIHFLDQERSKAQFIHIFSQQLKQRFDFVLLDVQHQKPTTLLSTLSGRFRVSHSSRLVSLWPAPSQAAAVELYVSRLSLHSFFFTPV